MEVKPDDLRPSPVSLAYAIAVLRPELNQQLEEALSHLRPLASQDCYGDNETEPCNCPVCEVRKAMAAVEQVRQPVIRSLRPQRLNYAELVYFEAWVAINKQCTSRTGLLETLMRQIGTTSAVAEYVSQRDMDVASTVVQWLGTNCGRAFVEQCEREWAARREERQDFEHVVHQAKSWTDYRNKSAHQKIADAIVERQSVSREAKEALKRDILKAMLYAQAKAAVADLEAQFEKTD